MGWVPWVRCHGRGAATARQVGKGMHRRACVPSAIGHTLKASVRHCASSSDCGARPHTASAYRLQRTHALVRPTSPVHAAACCRIEHGLSCSSGREEGPWHASTGNGLASWTSLLAPGRLLVALGPLLLPTLLLPLLLLRMSTTVLWSSSQQVGAE